MKKKRILALALVLVQLFVLLPVLQPRAKAVEAASDDEQLPVLNPVIEGTVRFGSFNYTSDKGEGSANDGDAAVQSAEDAVMLSFADVVPLVFEPVTTETVKAAAESAAAKETADDQTTDLSDMMLQLISSFVESLFRSITRLFGK